MIRGFACVVMLGLVAECGCSSGETGPAGDRATTTIHINGAGATLPYPIYSKWFAEYNRLHPQIQINYQSQGSGAGIRQLVSRTVFFGASDQPMKDDQLKSAPGLVLHVPTILGAVVPAYNLPGVSGELRFTGPVLADLALGHISKWNDPKLAELNRGTTLPDMDITFVHRADGSGTTYIWVDYLAKVSQEFKDTVGVDASVNWRVGIGAKGTEGVTGLVRQTPGALGYIELIYAVQNGLAYGSVQNSAGNFVRASVDTITAAAEGAAAGMPADFRISLTNPPGPNAYPISSYSWILLYSDPLDKSAAHVMVDFMKWALTDGQAFARSLGYAPLPPQVVASELQALQKIKTE